MTDTPRRRWPRPGEWLRLFARWLLREWAWWGLLLLLIAVVLFVSGVDCTERALRLSGLLLQGCGFVTVAYGLHSTGKSLKKDFWRAFVQYWKDFPLPWEKPTILGGTASVKAGADAVASGGYGTPRGMGLRERVAHLEKRTNELSKNLDATKNDLRQHASEYRANREKDRREWQAADSAVQTKLEGVVAGNLHVETAGLAMFVAGLIAASLAPEFPGSAVCSQPWRFW